MEIFKPPGERRYPSRELGYRGYYDQEKLHKILRGIRGVSGGPKWWKSTDPLRKTRWVQNLRIRLCPVEFYAVSCSHEGSPILDLICF